MCAKRTHKSREFTGFLAETMEILDTEDGSRVFVTFLS